MTKKSVLLLVVFLSLHLGATTYYGCGSMPRVHSSRVVERVPRQQLSCFRYVRRLPLLWQRRFWAVPACIPSDLTLTGLRLFWGKL